MRFVVGGVVALALAGGASADESTGAAAAVPLPPRGSRGTTLGTPAGGSFEWPRTLGATVLVAAIVVTGLKLAKRWMPAAAADLPDGIRVRQQVPLGTRGTLYLVQCGQRLLLVGATGSQLVTLTEIADPDEVSTLMGTARDAATQSGGIPHPMPVS
jgi:flagellar biogenesis protein FliO